MATTLFEGLVSLQRHVIPRPPDAPTADVDVPGHSFSPPDDGVAGSRTRAHIGVYSHRADGVAPATTGAKNRQTANRKPRRTSVLRVRWLSTRCSARVHATGRCLSLSYTAIAIVASAPWCTSPASAGPASGGACLGHRRRARVQTNDQRTVSVTPRRLFERRRRHRARVLMAALPGSGESATRRSTVPGLRMRS